MSTECFGFELQAVVPIAFNEWTVLGEADIKAPAHLQPALSLRDSHCIRGL
jgi:hypothetical protein